VAAGDLSSTNDRHAPFAGPLAIPQAPPDIRASVTIALADGPVVAGDTVTITVQTDPGTHFVWNPHDLSWDEEPRVTYTGEIRVSVDGVPVGDGGSVTFSRPGRHFVRAAAVTTGGTLVSSGPFVVHVAAAGPPVFTVVSPADGSVVNLDEGGGPVSVQLTTTIDQYFPLSVSIICDGQATTEQFTGTQYQKAVILVPMPLGPRIISVTCADPDGLSSTSSPSVVGHDVGAPHLQVGFPQPSANVIGDANGAVTVPMHGTAEDNQSGMAGGSATVAWALAPGGPWAAAHPATGSDFSNWSAEVLLAGFGAHTIFVRATDQAGNTTLVSVPVTVISSYVPGTLEDRLSEREYLAALLTFAQEQVTIPLTPPAPLDTGTLAGALGQPVGRLSQPLSAAADRGSREVNQLRVPVELLRARIAATHTATGPGAAGESSYRSAAYAALLAAMGTSYAELRLARGAAPAARQALAARLGIRLSATAPDELDQLVLDGANLTEAAVETLFGLPASTGADPLRVPSTPLLLTWQLAALALSWAEQDQHPNPPRAFAVLADPDVIGVPDVVGGTKGDPVRLLLAQRAAHLAGYATLLDGLRTGAADAAHGLAAMQAQALPGVDLADLEAKDGQGTDISAALEPAGLTRGGFLYLRALGRLAATGDLTAAEWSDAIAVLTGANKRSLYPAWQAQETAFVLSPDFFVLAGAGPEVNAHRADSGARAGWQSVLRSRIAQRQGLIGASAQAVAATEQAALPILRDALLTDLAPASTGDVGEEMSALFLLDVLAGGSLRATRIGQAVESVQSLLSAKRSGELPPAHPAAAWTLNDFDAFTSAWAWMGELGSWQAATMAFLFPERHLDPTLLVPSGGEALKTLVGNIRGSGPFGADQANSEAATYLGPSGMGITFTYLDPNRSSVHQTTLRDFSKTLPEPDSREIFWAVPMLLAQRLQSAGDYQAALDWYWIVYPYDVGSPVSIYNRIDTEAPFGPDLTFPPGWTAGLDPFALVVNRPAPYTRYTLLSIIRCHLDYADAEFTRETDESIAHARILYVTARRLLGAAQLQPVQPANPGEPTLAIPELDSLRARAEVQLAKLRQGRNIAGMPRTQGIPTTATVSQPTPYRFKTLLDRARQLAGQASQMEAGYLAALEKYDQRNLSAYDALKAIDLSAAQVTVAASRVKEASDAVTAATAQQAKADAMVTTYADAIAAPPNRYETNLLGDYIDMRAIRDNIAQADTVIGMAQAAANAASLTNEIFSAGAAAALDVGVVLATAYKGGREVAQNRVEALMQADQLQAGIEQRRDEWRIQQASAEQDSLIAAAQVVTATDQVSIATQEQGIASLQHDQAVATLKFLNGQFTNADLYLWMSNTLGGVYRYFLQQATATARLTQAQLAFERAEPAQTMIGSDYWQSPAQMTAAAAQADRRGLTGAEQLTGDLTRLDQYAFSSERRRLNLSQTFSLARLMPVEFLDFRNTGVIAFATPMALFDADFPGHYLRLIRQVRTSLVALVPPDRGIRATLYSNGISRVTTGQDGAFQDITLRHDPTVVALTTPVSASGVFDLDVQPDMLLPFESSGVDTTWELQLPQAANPFDFSSIVDVMLSIDYTALYDDSYRSQMTARLNASRDRGADRVFSLARDFPDQWYDLNNPPDPATRSVTITLRDADFPSAISGIATAAVAVRLASNDTVPATVVSLHRGTAGGDAAATDGIASTRRGNAASWSALYGASPAGDWQLAFGSDAAALFDSGGLDDILLIISWTGQAPLWAS
jgi:hypothetical protein